MDWTDGLDWWTDAKNHFYACNETYLSVGLHDTNLKQPSSCTGLISGKLLTFCDDNKIVNA